MDSYTLDNDVPRRQYCYDLDWVTPARSAGDFKFALQKGLEKSNTFVSASDTFFAGASHRTGFSPWHAIGWFNTITTGKRRQAANCVQSQLN